MESRLVFPDGLVTLQRLVGDPLCASFYGLDRNLIEHAEDPRADTATGLKNPPKTFHPQNAWFSQWQVADDGQYELLELFARCPSGQRDGVEATGQLHVAIDRLPGLHDAEAHERKFQFVAQVGQRIEDDALFPPGRCENIMDLVQD